MASRRAAAKLPRLVERPGAFPSTTATYGSVAGSSVSAGAASTVHANVLSRRMAASRRCSAATFAYGPVTSVSEKTRGFVVITMRCGPVRSIVSTIVRVASEISVVVTSAIGPSAEMTASAPANADPTAWASDGKPCTTFTASGNHCFDASRTNATTSSPRWTACATTSLPVFPDAPNTTIFMAGSLAQPSGTLRRWRRARPSRRSRPPRWVAPGRPAHRARRSSARTPRRARLPCSDRRCAQPRP